MIAKLSGILDSVAEDHAVIDVGGVGYLVHASTRTLAALPPPGAPVRLFVETQMRDDRIQLFGFLAAGERDWFQLLLKVQGVGARVALAILSVLGPDELLTAVAAQDKAAIARANGVGARLAQRVVSELKAVVGDLALGHGAASPVIVAERGPSADAVSALVNLGYRRSEALAAVAGAARALGPEAAVETLIRAGLRELAR